MQFQQYLGFIAFLTILTIGFWLLFFLSAIVPYWLTGAMKEFLKERKEKKQQALEQ